MLIFIQLIFVSQKKYEQSVNHTNTIFIKFMYSQSVGRIKMQNLSLSLDIRKNIFFQRGKLVHFTSEVIRKRLKDLIKVTNPFETFTKLRLVHIKQKFPYFSQNIAKRMVKSNAELKKNKFTQSQNKISDSWP